MRMKMKMKIILPVVASLLVFVIITLLPMVNNPRNITTKIEKYCAKSNEISLLSVTSFNWDTAYVDYQVYMCGEKIKEKYNLKGDFKRIETDYFYRIAFCKDGNLVNDSVLSTVNIYFDHSIEIIKPETLFVAEWKTESDGSRRLYLSLKDGRTRNGSVGTFEDVSALANKKDRVRLVQMGQSGDGSGQFEGYNSPMYRAAMDYYDKGICDNPIDQAAMDECLAVVIPIYSGAEADITGGAIYFHSRATPEGWEYHNSYTQVYVPGTEKFWFYK